MLFFLSQITEICGERYLALAPRLTLQSLQKDVVELLELQEGKFLLISRLAATFRKHHGRKFPLGQAKLEEFLRSLEGIAKVRQRESFFWSMILCSFFFPKLCSLKPRMATDVSNCQAARNQNWLYLFIFLLIDLFIYLFILFYFCHTQ